jgi:hypothetical protein
MAERTGCPIPLSLWSYVTVKELLSIIVWEKYSIIAFSEIFANRKRGDKTQPSDSQSVRCLFVRENTKSPSNPPDPYQSIGVFFKNALNLNTKLLHNCSLNYALI